MNILIQNIFVFLAVLLAVAFLVRKFMPKRSKSKKACGEDDCGCH